MTGSIQVKNGYYYTVIYVKDSKGNGQYKWKSTGLTIKGNKRKAEQILRERIAEYESKKDILPNGDIPFHKFMEDWLDVVKTQVKTTTYHQYSLIVNNRIIPYFESIKVSLRDLQPVHLQKYYGKLIKEGLSGNSVKHHHANIHKALNYALKSNWIAYNPADRVELPKKEKFIGKAYTTEQIKELLNVVKGTTIEAPVYLTAAFGLRRSDG